LLRLSAPMRFLAWLAPGRLRGMMDMVPRRVPAAGRAEQGGVFPARGARRARVALLAGCAQAVLDPEINASAIRLLNRLGVEVVSPPSTGCCGALPHHLGKTGRSYALAKANIAAWNDEIAVGGLDAILVTTSGCGTSIKDYGFLFRDDPQWAMPAARISALARDISQFLVGLDAPWPAAPAHLRVAYQSACSLQHGQQVKDEPKSLLRACGFEVVEPAEPHICCGSAGTYNLLQPELAGRLRARKVANLQATAPDVIASGNIGCMTQMAGATEIPIIHTVQLLDWATGGPAPGGLKARISTS
jgi:glycolate oxidase iron-sulfur subunit